MSSSLNFNEKEALHFESTCLWLCLPAGLPLGRTQHLPLILRRQVNLEKEEWPPTPRLWQKTLSPSSLGRSENQEQIVRAAVHLSSCSRRIVERNQGGFSRASIEDAGTAMLPAKNMYEATHLAMISLHWTIIELRCTGWRKFWERDWRIVVGKTKWSSLLEVQFVHKCLAPRGSWTWRI